jgi:maltose O-acetyltransferase
MNKSFFAFLNNCLNLFPPYGMALDWRGRLANKVLKKSGERLRISSNVNIYNPDRVSVGSHVYIGFNTYIGGGDVCLEDEVMIGPFCAIVAGNHTMKNDSYRYGEYDYGTIKIGRGTWLGAHVTVTSNVRIGKGCLIAAGSVVTKDVEDFSVVGGVPAQLINRNKTGH